MNNELKIWAKYYHSLGLNVTCITNYITEHNFAFRSLAKTPYHKFDHLYDSRQTIEELESYDWDNATGVGIVLGFDNIVVIDIDGCDKIEIVEEMLQHLGLKYDYEWLIRSGSHNGFHVVVKANLWPFLQGSNNRGFIPSEKYGSLFNKIEILTKAHLVLPPSIHKSTLEYEFVNCSRPKSSPEEIHEDNYDNNFRDEFLLKVKSMNPSSTGLVPGFSFPGISVDFEEIDLERYAHPLYIIVDVETDGLPKDFSSDYKNLDNWPKIIQIAWLIMDEEGFIIKEESSTIMSSNLQVPDMVNLESENIMKIGSKLRNVLKDFMRDVKVCGRIVAHNSDFDLNVIQAESLRCNLPNDFEKDYVKTYCTMKSTTDIVGIENAFGYKYPKLEELYFHLFGEQIVGSHNAIKDVWATAKCFWKLKIDGIIQD